MNYHSEEYNNMVQIMNGERIFTSEMKHTDIKNISRETDEVAFEVNGIIYGLGWEFFCKDEYDFINAYENMHPFSVRDIIFSNQNDWNMYVDGEAVPRGTIHLLSPGSLERTGKSFGLPEEL